MSINPVAFWQQWGELIGQLTQREIKARYKQSILGYAWVAVVPLLRLAVMTVVFSYFFRIETGDIPYSIFLFTALVPWLFTAGAISQATGSLMANASLITKIRMPRIIFPISAVLVKLVDYVISLFILLILMLVMGVEYQWTMVWVPLIFVVHFVMIMGVSMWLSALNVFYRDVENLLEVGLMMWMYLSPIMYPPEFIPEKYRMWFNLNPMMGIINAYRNTMLHGEPIPWTSFGFGAVVALVIAITGYWFFTNRAKYFADVI